MTIEDQTAPKDERCCSCGSRIICHGCGHDPHVGECQQATGDATGDYGPCGCTRPRPSSPSLDEIAEEIAYEVLLHDDYGSAGENCASAYCVVCNSFRWTHIPEDRHEFAHKLCNCSVREQAAATLAILQRHFGASK